MPEIREEQVEELLLATRERLAFGWTQGTTLQDIHGEPTSDPAEAARFCVLGAFAHASHALHADADTYHSAMQRLCEAIDPAATRAAPLVFIPVWNDAQERTQDDVLAAFDAALSRPRAAQLA
ncbi:MAG TPA: hypothetical protein VMT59_05815 [Gaiellaceae bacterium]|nr:hypothetical protein [Gaiellaceae bacterium]